MTTRLRVALAAYSTVWAAIAAGVIYGIVHAGYSFWVGVVSASLLFAFVNGSLAYRARVRLLRLEGKEPPRYFAYLFFPQGRPKFKDEAPRSTHLLVGIGAILTGIFCLFCGVALAFDAEWSRISQPLLAASICIGLASLGAAFIFLAWRLLSFRPTRRENVA